MAVTPKDAAAIILLKDPADPKVFWIKRSMKLSFMGGFYAFPGGQLDAGDSIVKVAGCEAADETAMRVCAVREFFEETGVLLAEGAEKMGPEQMTEARRSISSGGASLNDVIERNGLTLSATSLIFAGRWVTPAFAPRRFDTWFFLAWLPQGQEPDIEPGELESGEWIRPEDAVSRFKRGEALMAPPILHALKSLASCADNIADAARVLTAVPEAGRGVVRRVEFGPGIFCFPVRTPTLPPATHTNCYIIGGTELVVIDPASIYEEEQQELDAFIDTLIAEGRRVREIFLTHHHGDHVGGSNHLRDRLDVPVAAHRITAERLSGSVKIDRFVEDDELIEIEGDPGWRLRALHTPGHTRGHLCFYEERSGIVMTGDLVVGQGTVVIDPPEGNMRQYFDSLRRVLSLPKLSFLFGAHGPVIGSAVLKINEYIEHRTMREEKIFDAVRSGAASSAEIVPVAYTDVAPQLYPLAERSTIAHLEKLEEEGRIARVNGVRFTVA